RPGQAARLHLHRLPRHRRVQERLSELPRAEDRRPERGLHRRRAYRLQEERAQPPDHARAGFELFGQGHRRPRRLSFRPQDQVMEAHRMSLRATALLLALAFAASASASPTGNATRGKQKAAPCAACHGDGNKTLNDTYPKLAGQYPDYLSKALHEYKNGKRKN